jgi:hypothetical protein
MTRALRLAAVSVAAFFVCTTGVDAQSTSSRSTKPDSGWGYTVTPYAWLAGLKGDVGVGPVDGHVDLSPGDVLKDLKFAFMAYGEARHNGVIFGLDVIYSRIGDGTAVAIRGETGSLDLTVREAIIQPMIGHSVGNKTLSVDALLGFRYWHYSADLDVDRPNGISNTHSRSTDWFDATAGLRGHWMPKEHVRLMLGGDGGGGGAWNDWQAYGTAGYDVSTRWTVGAGYRIIGVMRRTQRFLNNTDMKGFGIYGTYRFGKH